MPAPMVALPCGSRSTSSTRWSSLARPAARLTLVVVLPTPPFWFATQNIFAMYTLRAIPLIPFKRYIPFIQYYDINCLYCLRFCCRPLDENQVPLGAQPGNVQGLHFGHRPFAGHS